LNATKIINAFGAEVAPASADHIPDWREHPFGAAARVHPTSRSAGNIVLSRLETDIG
jgi:hypothetical protein